MRKEIVIEIEDNGNPLKFKIKQMSAMKQHRFLIKLLLLLTKSGIASKIDIPSDVDLKNMKSDDLGKLDVAGLLDKLGSIDYDSVEPLLLELLGCCSRIADGIEMQCTPDTIDGYVDNVMTIFKLQFKAAEVNFGFFQGAASSQDSEAAGITIPKRTPISKG